MHTRFSTAKSSRAIAWSNAFAIVQSVLPSFRIFLAAFVVGSLSPNYSRSAEEADLRASTTATRAEIMATVNGQLAALRMGDSRRAYTFNGAVLQSQLSLAGFERMVERNYPEIWQSTRAEFGVIRDNGERGTVLVHVYATESDAPYDYFLRREDDRWKIVGVLRHAANGNDRL